MCLWSHMVCHECMPRSVQRHGEYIQHHSVQNSSGGTCHCHFCFVPCIVMCLSADCCTDMHILTCSKRVTKEQLLLGSGKAWLWPEQQITLVMMVLNKLIWIDSKQPCLQSARAVEWQLAHAHTQWVCITCTINS